MMMKEIIFYLVTLCFLTSCTSWEDTDGIPEQVQGYRPIYNSYDEVKMVQTLEPRPISQAGKIYVYDKYLFINELNQGVHIIDNSNPKNPRNVSFIKIPTNVDIAVKQKVLYADNGFDMIALDISNPLAVRVVKRIANVFPREKYPPQMGYFECPDDSKGIVVDWEYTVLKKPKCRR